MPSQSPPSQLSRTLQYLYFMRFSLLLWLFPFVFAALDSGRFVFSTTTLSRGIFVPEYVDGYLCVGFFVIASGCIALVTARTTVINGIERFTSKPLGDEVDPKCAAANKQVNMPPRWITSLLVDSDTRGESWAIVVAMIPTLLTFLYLVGCGTFEAVPFSKVIGGLALGAVIAALFWYVLNAWYYLAYRHPREIKSGEQVVLGRNAARTILLPRAWFGLRRPGSSLDDKNSTLEDIKTRVVINVFQEEAVKRLVQNLGLPGTGYFDENGSVYEAQFFTILILVGFVELLLMMYPLTAPRLNSWSLTALLIIPWTVFVFIYAIWGATSTSQKLLRWWQIALSICAGGFGGSILFIWLFSMPDRFPTLASILLLAISMGLILSGLAFFLDRFRVPVLTFLVLIAVLPRTFHIYDFGAFEEHYVSTVHHQADANLLPTPAQIVDARLPKVTEAEDQYPLIVVTATGGGLHASAWTARVLRQIYLSFPKEEWPSLTSHIVLMSTVSGGSVGVSYYLKAIHKNPTAPNLDGMVVSAQCSSLEAVGWGLLYYDFARAIIPGLPWITPPSSGDGDLDTTPLGKDRTWALRRAFERNNYDRYCFKTAQSNLPSSLTPLNPGIEQPRISLHDRLFPRPPRNTTRLTLQALLSDPKFPAFTMNTTTVEAGNRFLLANYRLPDYFLGAIEGPPAESFINLLPGKEHPDLPLASAAQLSATFPYVSSAARIPRRYTDNSAHFVDGGYYDDDGTSSAIEFLRYVLDSPVTGQTDPAQRNVMNKLGDNRRLRIMLIEIRNSADNDLPKIAKPPKALTPNGVVTPKSYQHAGLLQQLGFPLEGFWQAGHGSVTGRDRNGLDLLVQSHEKKLELHQIIFDDVTQPASRWYVVSAQDPLSWSLTPRERGDVAGESDPHGRGKRLTPCYQAVYDWFSAFDTQWKQGQGTSPTRCE